MVDGSAALLTMHKNFAEVLGPGVSDPLANTPFYDVYETADDGEYVAVGAMEPQFFSQLLVATGIDFPDDGSRDDPASWPELAEKLAAAFRAKSRLDWARIGHEAGACLSAVWSLEESENHPHMRYRIERQREQGGTGGERYIQAYMPETLVHSCKLSEYVIGFHLSISMT